MGRRAIMRVRGVVGFSAHRVAWVSCPGTGRCGLMSGEVYVRAVGPGEDVGEAP